MRPRAAIALVATLLAGGCVGDQPRPSVVDSLRILGLASEPALAVAGEPLTLDLLWADPEPGCSRLEPCPAGRTCVEGRCRRDGPTELAWLLLPLSALEAAEDLDLSGTTGGECILDRCPPPMPCGEDADCLGDAGRCVDGFCLPCYSFGPATFCCGGEELSTIETIVPELDSPPRSCDDPTAVDLAQLIQIQVQVCAGGEIDLCIEPGANSFGCVGEGADSAVAQSRQFIEETPAYPNERPEIAELTLDGAAWPEEGLELRGCLEEGCRDRRCSTDEDCEAGQRCSSSRCREVLALTLGEGCEETYLEACEEPTPCAADDDCETSHVCVEGSCLRIEQPLVSFFATAGSLSPGRALADEDADGRPDLDVLETTWTPPVLEPCAAADDPCAFGTCDPAVGRCTGEVELWAVLRDGRRGQSWAARTIRLVP